MFYSFSETGKAAFFSQDIVNFNVKDANRSTADWAWVKMHL